MYAGPNQNEYQGRQLFIGNAQLALQALCVFCITLTYARKEFLTVFPVFRVGIDLIHQAVFLAVLFCRPVWCLVNKTPQVVHIGGSFRHKVIFYLAHTVFGGLDDQVIQILKICINHSSVISAMLRQGANTGAVKSQFGKTVIAFFHKLNFFGIPLFLRVIRHRIAPFHSKHSLQMKYSISSRQKQPVCTVSSDIFQRSASSSCDITSRRLRQTGS